jgi:hypothetical protein
VAARDKVRLAFKLFDSEGVKLVNLLNMGTRGLDEAALKAQKFGLSISEIDASRVEAANDAMTSIKSLIEGVGQQLAVKIAPVITALAQKLEAGATSAEKIADALIRTAVGAGAGVVEAGHRADRVSVGSQGIAAFLSGDIRGFRRAKRTLVRMRGEDPAGDLVSAFINEQAPPTTGNTAFANRVDIPTHQREQSLGGGELPQVIDRVSDTVEEIRDQLTRQAATDAAAVRNAQMMGAR